ncbi:AF1514 family protein [Desulfonema magnum]|uniref:DUF5619 n=1 Tax=Desulfonema magnum TaxID=45655 RepID=A0A975BP00_9BACT|nr:AF1514 family protein [Desulfonema magnum]QTA88772.1 DUF5619 [Desulfonema magnum]
MKACKTSIKEYLSNPVKISEDPCPDFNKAKDIAKQKAKTLGTDPMLLAWYQGKTGDYVPKAECGSGDKPGWIVYAESRGGNITIDINDEEYIFIYRSHV